MAIMIELAGNGNSFKHWSANVFCPLSNETKKSIFCPKRNVCALPKVLIRAENESEATAWAVQAQSRKEIPLCLNQKPYKVKVYYGTVSFQRELIDDL